MDIEEKKRESGNYGFILNKVEIGANNISADNILKRVFLINDDKLRGYVINNIENVKSNGNIFITENNKNEFYILLFEIQEAIYRVNAKIASEIVGINEKIKHLNFYYSENIANKTTPLRIEAKVFKKITDIEFKDASDYLNDNY